MPAIISQVEGLGKSWGNCTEIRIKPPPTHFKYSEGGSADLEPVGRTGGEQFPSDRLIPRWSEGRNP